MNIVQHIIQLLYRHDCVIIPQLGGFIANYQKAQIDYRGEIIRPPSRNVIFNPKLKNNDGLLINHIVEQEHLDYQQATDIITSFVHEFQKDLERRTWVEWKDIGQFTINLEEKLEFKPSDHNFLLDSFGLPVVRCSPIIRQKSATYTGTSSTQQQQTRPLPKRAKRRFPAWAMGGAAAVALLLIVPLSYRAINGENTTTTPSQPIAQTVEDNNTANEVTTDITTPTPSSQTASIFPLASDTSAETNAATDESMTDISTEDETPVIEEPLVDIPEDAKTYIIVVGAFSKSSNARRLIRQLEKEGYFPDLTETSKGLQRVGIQMTCAAEDLDQHLEEVRRKFNKKAWILGN